MPITNVKSGHIIGYKYFGFGGLTQASKGIRPFEGTKQGNNTAFNLFLTPKTDKSFKVNVWLDGPWDNATWKGKKIGEIVVPANAKRENTKFTINVSQFVDGLDKKHAVYLVAEADNAEPLFDMGGLGFSSDKKPLVKPALPTVSISFDGQALDLPATPLRSTNENGIVGYDIYKVTATVKSGSTPKVTASASDASVKVSIAQATSVAGQTVVKFNYKGLIKTYNIKFIEKK